MTTSQQHPLDTIRTRAGREAVQAILDAPEQTLIALDFDGTIAPIVDDPDQARANPTAVAALSRLGSRVGTIVVITGRPAETAVRLGDFRSYPELGNMIVFGQYGAERWDARTDQTHAEPEPAKIREVANELPGLLDTLGLTDVRIEHKGRAVGVHTREHEDPVGAFTRLLPAMQDLADRHGLRLEPGKLVLEIRSSDTDKGAVLRTIVAERGPRQVVFLGDDLGDLPAFDAVSQLRDNDGVHGLLICSASAEEEALAERADLIAAGTDGVASWLTGLAEHLDAGFGQPAGC